MNIEDFRLYCLDKKGVTEAFPFDKNTLVFKVMGKMFALTDVQTFSFINLKCDPEKAIELREQYDFVKPGYHMNKQLWNSVYMEWQLENKLLEEWIDDSYNLVTESLTKKLKEDLKNI